MNQIYQVVKLVRSPEQMGLVPAVFWNGTFYNKSDAIKRQTKGVEDLMETFIIYNIDPNPQYEFGLTIPDMRIGSGVVISAELISYKGYVTDYTALYAIIQY